jgi:hypothetical protein
MSSSCLVYLLRDLLRQSYKGQGVTVPHRKPPLSLDRKAARLLSYLQRSPRKKLGDTQTEMFSRTLPQLSRSFQRASHTTIRTVNLSPVPRIFRYSKNPSLQARRFGSSGRYPPPPPPPPPFPSRQGHGYNPRYRTKFDPDTARHAKPLLTSEQIFNQRTGIIAVVITGGSIIFYVTHLEDVPVSGRTRFICYSDKSVEEEGRLAYRHVMSDYRHAILPEYDARTRQVQRVMNRLIPASGMENVEWEVFVIDSPG